MWSILNMFYIYIMFSAQMHWIEAKPDENLVGGILFATTFDVDPIILWKRFELKEIICKTPSQLC